MCLLCNLGIFGLLLARRDELRGVTSSVEATTLAKEVKSKFQLITTDAPQCYDRQPLEADDVDYTLCLQTSENRLWMMEYHCSRWDNFISLAVHSNRSKREIDEDLAAMGCINHRVKVTTHPIAEGSEKDYPINYLRNVAIAAATTTHVFNLDMDFWTDENIYKTLQSSNVREALVKDNELAIVVPALAIYREGKCKHNDSEICKTILADQMPTDRYSVIEKLRNKEVTMFDVANHEGHDSTGYREWYKHNVEVLAYDDDTHYSSSSLRNIECLTSNRYEPYIIFRNCQSTPPFQEAFSGYGKNKLTWTMQLRRLGWTFGVLDDAFVVHYPHKHSQSRKEWNRTPSELKKSKQRLRPSQLGDEDLEKLNWTDYKRGMVDKLFVDFKHWLQEEVVDNHRVPMCDTFEGKADDDRLWVAPSIK